MHHPVPAPQGPAEIAALEQGDDQSRGDTTAMDVEEPRRDATRPAAIREQHPSQMASAPGDTSRRAHHHVESRTAVPATRAPVPADPVADDRAAATGYRHDASKHRGVPRRSAPPR